MKRTELPRPFTTALIDLNSENAYTAQGKTPRKAPRLTPVPSRTVSLDPTKLTLEPWRKELQLYPQLYFVVGRDIAVREEAPLTDDVILGMGFGLAFSDNGIVMASPEPSPRDTFMCYWYSLYSDNSQVLTDELYTGLNARDLVLTVESETLGKHTFCQKDLLFDPVQVLQEVNCFVPWRKYDWISLGAADAAIKLPADKQLKKGEVITVTCQGVGSLQITVDDQRDPNHIIPGWKPREYFYHPEY